MYVFHVVTFQEIYEIVHLPTDETIKVWSRGSFILVLVIFSRLNHFDSSGAKADTYKHFTGNHLK